MQISTISLTRYRLKQIKCFEAGVLLAKKKKNLAPVVSVLNMKGGVGKTTISGNLFREVYRTKKINTLLIDIDPQFNLTQLLMTRAKYDNILTEKKTIYSVFQHESPDSVFAVSEDYHLNIPEIESLVTKLKKLTVSDGDGGSVEKTLHLLAGDFDLAKLNLKGSNELRIPRKRFIKFVDAARKKYDLVTIDCNPSTSFLTKCALEVSTHILIPVRPDKYSMLGVEMIHHFVKIYLGDSLIPDLKILLNDIPKYAGPKIIARSLRSDDTYGKLVLVNELPHSKVLSAKQDYTGFAVDQGVPYSQYIRDKLVAIADEYSRHLGV